MSLDPVDFWKVQCPARQAGLNHAHWNSCHPEGGHPIDTSGRTGNKHRWVQCCHCEADSTKMDQPEQVDVAQRLEAMGLSGPYKSEARDETLVEPKAITGKGPQGSIYRHGRSRDGKGTLSDDDKARLIFFNEFVPRAEKAEEDGLPVPMDWPTVDVRLLLG